MSPNVLMRRKLKASHFAWGAGRCAQPAESGQRPVFHSLRPSSASCKSSTSEAGFRNQDFMRLRSGPNMWERKRGRFHWYAASEYPCFFARDYCQLHFRTFAHESRDGCGCCAREGHYLQSVQYAHTFAYGSTFRVSVS